MDATMTKSTAVAIATAPPAARRPPRLDRSAFRAATSITPTVRQRALQALLRFGEAPLATAGTLIAMATAWDANDAS